ncbi:hypothetical protein [Paenibacillus periandrae]|uniref:hypothetical protein n=1 Tax=Paenibacillus periandrae TaxID=1761741 RepID=UPI001F09F76D|nr:hypothetical protein [Paenibacillus periandrae]
MIVHNKGDFVRSQGGVRLIPGVNNITDGEWAIFKADSLNQELIDDGEIVAQEIDGKAKTLADLNNGEAAALIKDTFDLNLLASLLKEEEAGKNRKSVLDIISKQAATIEKEIEEAKKKAKEGDDNE